MVWQSEQTPTICAETIIGKARIVVTPSPIATFFKSVFFIPSFDKNILGLTAPLSS
jgi:hypothetical protein